MTSLGTYQNNIPELPSLSQYRYENIFKIYQGASGEYFYNILNNVVFPQDLSANLFTELVVNERTPWTIISYNAYQTIELWWLIALSNNIRNPFELPENRSLKILKPEYVQSVLSQIQANLQ